MSKGFTFDNIASKPVPSILRNFSAPVKLTTDLSNDDLAFLMVHDRDGFNRWEAGQKYMLRAINTMLSENTQDVPDTFLKTYSELLNRALDPQSDKALMARAISIPDIPTVAQEQVVVDPQAIYEAREAMLVAIKKTYKDTLVKLYEANAQSGEYSLSAEAMGQRALRNTVLRLLTATRGSGCAERSKTHYEAATNMTDRMAALSRLVNIDTPFREEALSDFYQRFKNYQLVVDKWFSVQAIAEVPDIMERLGKLKSHKEFNIKNPNRVRSLYGAFAMNNPVSFHRADGKGYDFLKNAVIELNGINPQIAARLLTPMREWRRYTQDRQEKMEAALQDIANLKNLSPDVFEIVSKSLNG